MRGDQGQGYFFVQEKKNYFQRVEGKQARMESLHGKIFTDNKPADPAVPQRAMIFFYSWLELAWLEWSSEGAGWSSEEEKHRHCVDCSALHVWLRLPVAVDFEYDVQRPLSISPIFTRHTQVQKQVTLLKCISNWARSYRRSYLALIKFLGFCHTEAQSRWPQRSLQTHRSVCISLPKPQLTASWTPWQILSHEHKV